MIEQFSEKIVNNMVEYNCIKAADKGNYMYGLVCLLEYCISVFVMLAIGILTGKFFSTLIFLIFFIEIKKRCGGLHANTYLRCLLGTCAIYSMFTLWLAGFMLEHIQWTLMSVFASFVLLELVGAVKHPAVGWTEQEYRTSILASRLVVALEAVVIHILYFLDVNKEMIVYMAFALCLNAVLLILSKIKEDIKNEKE